VIKVSTEGKQVSAEQQDDHKIINRSTEESNRMESANKLTQQNIVPAAAGEPGEIKENETVTADSVLTIDDENASLMQDSTKA
jgi:hypothetical protein